jgi:hypothetical protein
MAASGVAPISPKCEAPAITLLTRVGLVLVTVLVAWATRSLSSLLRTRPPHDMVIALRGGATLGFYAAAASAYLGMFLLHAYRHRTLRSIVSRHSLLFLSVDILGIQYCHRLLVSVSFMGWLTTSLAPISKGCNAVGERQSATYYGVALSGDRLEHHFALRLRIRSVQPESDAGLAVHCGEYSAGGLDAADTVELQAIIQDSFDVISVGDRGVTSERG